MSVPRNSCPLPGVKPSQPNPAFHAQKASGSHNTPTQPAWAQLDGAIEALVDYSARNTWPAIFAACVAGEHIRAARPYLGALALMRCGVSARELAGLGWTAESLSVVYSLGASLPVVAPVVVTEASARAFRYGLYHAGARQPGRVESAADRELRSRRQWSRPLDQLLADRKAVA